MHHAYSVQYPDCPVEDYLESREGEEGGGEGKGWEGRVAGGRGAEGRGLIAISNSGLDCCLHNSRENHGHSLVAFIKVNTKWYQKCFKLENLGVDFLSRLKIEVKRAESSQFGSYTL